VEEGVTRREACKEQKTHLYAIDQWMFVGLRRGPNNAEGRKVPPTGQMLGEKKETKQQRKREWLEIGFRGHPKMTERRSGILKDANSGD